MHLPTDSRSANHGALTTPMAPLTRDDVVPASEQSARLALATEPVPMFDAGELFGDGEQTVVTPAPFELKPRFTGRKAALDALTQALARATSERELQFAVVVGDPGMGKSRLVAELGKA